MRRRLLTQVISHSLPVVLFFCFVTYPLSWINIQFTWLFTGTLLLLLLLWLVVAGFFLFLDFLIGEEER